LTIVAEAGILAPLEETGYTPGRPPKFAAMSHAAETPLILIQFVHPFPHRSKVNRALLEAVKGLAGVEVNDLYERYPDFYIDTLAEQRLLLAADLVVFQYPFYWYSAPAMLKQWLDVVLEYGFAYDRGRKPLQGKRLFSVVTAGQPEEAYRPGLKGRFTIEELLRPHQQTAYQCGMQWEPPLVVHGARRLEPEQIHPYAEAYRKRLEDYIAQLGGGRPDGAA